MKKPSEILASQRIQLLSAGPDGMSGVINHPIFKKPMAFIVSWGGGWEHVSVSFYNRCPTWDEMCIAKDLFWYEEERVIQYHPPKSEYVNRHPYTLHLWKPIDSEIPAPPREFV